MLAYIDDNLAFEGQSIADMAHDIGTPFFLVSERRLRENFAALAGSLGATPAEVRIRYCAKTNNESAILEILADCGSDVLVSYPAEALLALNCGFLPHRIAYQKPVIREGEIRALLRAGITLIHAFRMQDLDCIESAAREEGIDVRVMLRLRDDFSGAFLSPLSFLTRRLGFGENDLVRAALRVRDSARMALRGINCYGGTQQESIRHDRLLLRRLIGLAGKLKAEHGIGLEEINLGGGLPSPWLRRIGVRSILKRLRDAMVFPDPEQSLEEAGRIRSDFFREECGHAGLEPAPLLAVEPGRAIVADAAVLVSTVRAVEGKWLFLDAGRNFLGESPLLLTRPILPAVRHPLRREAFYHLSGGTLNTTDVLDLRRRLQAPEPGDVLVFCAAGAYSISRASRYGGLSPAVYLLRLTGGLAQIRREEELSDLTGPMLPGALRRGEAGEKRG
jgi:diaminopimelate decarboxylase